MKRLPTARQYRPLLPKWSGAECGLCADPIEYVVLDDEGGARVAVERRVAAGRDHAGMVAARMVGPQLHGYRITKARPLAKTHIPMRLHLAVGVCEEYEPPFEQPSLLTTEEN